MADDKSTDASYLEYPLNLERAAFNSKEEQSEYRLYKKKLLERQTTLFCDKQGDLLVKELELEFLCRQRSMESVAAAYKCIYELTRTETERKASDPVSYAFTTAAALHEHLKRTDSKTPDVRYVMIKLCEDDESHLNCSSDMFKLVCSHHQVHPSFLDAVLTFGLNINDAAVDNSLVHFNTHDHISHANKMHLSYLLRSVEYDEGHPRPLSLPDNNVGLADKRRSTIGKLRAVSSRSHRAILDLKLNVMVLRKIHEWYEAQLQPRSGLDARTHARRVGPNIWGKDFEYETRQAFNSTGFLEKTMAVVMAMEAQRSQLKCLVGQITNEIITKKKNTTNIMGILTGALSLVIANVSGYCLYHSAHSIPKLRKYESQAETAAGWSDAAKKRLWDTRYTVGAGFITASPHAFSITPPTYLLTLLFKKTTLSLLSSLYYVLLGTSGFSLRAIVWAALLAAAELGASEYMKKFWGRQHKIPMMDDYNKAVSDTLRVVGLADALAVGWGFMAVLKLFGY
ncbi:hypothetical protein B0T17DRAFT_507410 [Bombardia bombarda]|uniref:CorA-like transporter domain-containing protein n=1 Tax=Bombardia bombarda TaxID=252184 RepID=A0AA40CAD1_9PEZI|nr:hypothetical protein B0T17DRAFT_507410 [Bombardia bombarda]